MGNTTSAVLDNIVQGSNCAFSFNLDPYLCDDGTGCLTSAPFLAEQSIGRKLTGYESGL